MCPTYVFFFFSSRRRHTRSLCDWSSDVCSSDLSAPRSPHREATMDAIVERVGGVDVGQATVVATVLVGGAHERAKKETRTFRTVTRELLELREWFLAKEVTHVALEGTGIYWRPV